MYAALEVKEDETTHELVETLMRTAVDKGWKFKVLEVLGTFKLGTIEVVRFRTDAPRELILEMSRNRLVIALGTGDHKGEFRSYDGLEEGPVATMTMTQACFQPLIKRTYRGPLVNMWERQFLSNAKKVP